MLDQEMLEIVRRVRIARRVTPDANLPVKRGQVVAQELGGRYLLRYMLPHQVGQLQEGSRARQFVTPTPYSADDIVSWLYLPKPTGRREFVLLLDPGKIAVIQGPRWVRLGNGIEYILPEGFQREAIVAGWELNMEER
jgi:hypothetical protein